MEKGFTINCLDHGFVRVIDWMGADLDILEAARISYKSPSKGVEADKKLLAYLWKNQHTSPFEQCIIKFNIKLPLFVQAQIVRHRTQRLNQVSARYTQMKEEFYIPTSWRKQDTKNKQGSINDNKWKAYIPYKSGNVDASNDLERHCRSSYFMYKKMLESGIAREMARMVLPQNLYTEIYSQWDLHNLMRFFSLRLNKHAQWEVRMYALAMYNIFKELYPWTAEAWEKYKIVVKEVQLSEIL